MATNHGSARAANSSSPAGCSSHSTSRQRRCASNHGPTTSAGSSTPIKPLASTDAAAQAQAMSSQRRDRTRPSSARAKASTVAVIRPPTSMSRLAYWAPMKKNGQVANTSKLRRASSGPCQRRTAKNSAAPITQAPTNGAKRALNGFTPSSAMAAMSSQYISGGL